MNEIKNDYTEIVNKVVNIFKPQDFILLFIYSGDVNIKLDKINYKLEDKGKYDYFLITRDP